METLQQTMRQNYADGGPGVLVSGLVWLMTAIIIIGFSDKGGMLALFIGGMAIHPISSLIDNRLKRPGISEPDKSLTRLALLTLPLLFAGLYLGYLLSEQRIALFFSVTAVTIGLRYLIFQCIYGLKAYWVLGFILMGLGLLASLAPPVLALQIVTIVGMIELLFGIWLTHRFLKTVI